MDGSYGVAAPRELRKLTAGSKAPGRPTCSFCGSQEIVKVIDTFRFCQKHSDLMAADDDERVVKDRRARFAHLDPGPVHV